MDPLSDILSLLRIRSYVSRGLEAGGDWSVYIGPHDGVKVFALTAGECWLKMEEVEEDIRLAAGDCLVLPRGRAFQMATSLSLPAENILSFLNEAPDGAILPYQGGGDFSVISGHFTLNAGPAQLLLSVLPPVVLLRSETAKSELRWCLERMNQELRDPQPGGHIVAQQLATILLVQMLRLHLADEPSHSPGWLAALADPQLGAAIRAMHRETGRRWTVQALAAIAGMSRTVFAVKFKSAAGSSPMEYLTRWRMLVAADRLTHSSDSISSIALAIGYESESAFSIAFKKVMGTPPRQYSRRHRREAEMR